MYCKSRFLLLHTPDEYARAVSFLGETSFSFLRVLKRIFYFFVAMDPFGPFPEDEEGFVSRRPDVFFPSRIFCF